MNYYLENPGKHKFLVKCLGLYNLLIKRYFLRIILAMFKKSSFVHIKNRITDPAWYRIHINDIRKYFS